MKYSFNFCHGSRTVGFSTSTIFVDARPPARLLCRYVHILDHCSPRKICEISGVGLLTMRAGKLGLAPSEQIEMILV